MSKFKYYEAVSVRTNFFTENEVTLDATILDYNEVDNSYRVQIKRPESCFVNADNIGHVSAGLHNIWVSINSIEGKKYESRGSRDLNKEC